MSDGDHSSGPGGHHDAGQPPPGDLPYSRLHQATTVERKAGKKVEEPDQEIGEGNLEHEQVSDGARFQRLDRPEAHTAEDKRKPQVRRRR